MRRVVGISARSAVAVALPLAGALYLAAEAREAMIRRYSESTPDVQPPTRIETTTHASPRRCGDGGNQVKPGNPPTAGSNSLTNPAAPMPQMEPTPPQADNELAAEQQAAQMPAQEPPKAKDTHIRQIVISIPDRRLALLEDGQLIKVYPVAVGKIETPSPDGEFTIINHAVNPTYRHDGKVVGPGKSNPLGTRWMGLSAKGYGIHGTNVQSSVGKVASHGCFRMKKTDVEDLYTVVRVGDAVSVRAERDEVTASLFASNTTDGTKTGAEVASASPVSTPVAADQ